MNKENLKEYQNLDIQEMDLEDNIIRKKNEQTKLRSKISVIGHQVTEEEEKLVMVRHQKRILLGRDIIELEKDDTERKG